MDKKGFYERVYKIVGKIPEGKVMTYGLIGFLLGSRYYARRVGSALANAHGRGLPCHRVVNSKGELAPPHVFGGVGNQYRILKGEGVFFKSNGSVDLKRSLWRTWDGV
ncbi:MAG TPA: MGMT family protein [Clostridia bacterium]|nr:MGMT family protein [Clostridia bacterium]